MNKYIFTDQPQRIHPRHRVADVGVGVLPRVGARDQVALVVPGKARLAARRIDQRGHVAPVVIAVLPHRAVRQHLPQRKGVHRVPGGQRRLPERIAHQGQVAAFVVALLPALTVGIDRRLKQLAAGGPLIAPFRAVRCRTPFMKRAYLGKNFSYAGKI